MARVPASDRRARRSSRLLLLTWPSPGYKYTCSMNQQVRELSVNSLTFFFFKKVIRSSIISSFIKTWDVIGQTFVKAVKMLLGMSTARNKEPGFESHSTSYPTSC